MPALSLPGQNHRQPPAGKACTRELFRSYHDVRRPAHRGRGASRGDIGRTAHGERRDLSCDSRAWADDMALPIVPEMLPDSTSDCLRALHDEAGVGALREISCWPKERSLQTVNAPCILLPRRKQALRVSVDVGLPRAVKPALHGTHNLVSDFSGNRRRGSAHSSRLGQIGQFVTTVIMHRARLDSTGRTGPGVAQTFHVARGTSTPLLRRSVSVT